MEPTRTTGRAGRAFCYFVGLHQPADAVHFDACCISINRLRGRRRPVRCDQVLVDSGAFTELARHGRYRHPVEDYAAELYRLHASGVVNIVAAVAQDYMCEPAMMARTGLTIRAHQRLTISRYDALLAELGRLFDGSCPFTVMPVLQGHAPRDYVRHIHMYGSRLMPEMWVGVGSVCKRNGSPQAIVEILHAIRSVRQDLQLHGFGLKRTALEHPSVRSHLASADSMAWSFAARRQGRNPNSWREARRFVSMIAAACKHTDQMPVSLDQAGHPANEIFSPALEIAIRAVRTPHPKENRKCPPRVKSTQPIRPSGPSNCASI